MAHIAGGVRAFMVSIVLGFSIAPAHAAPDLVLPAKAFNHAVPKSIIKVERGVTRARVVKADFTALEAARDSLRGGGPPQVMRLELFDGHEATLLITGSETLPDGTTTFRGHVAGRAFSSVTMAQRGDILAVNVVAPGFVFQVRYVGDGLHEVREIDQSQFDDHGAYKPIPVDAPPMDAAVANDAADTIDVMVAYTPAAKAGAGSAAAMATLIALAITETNDAYAAAGVTQRLRLVHAMEVVGYTDAGDMSVDLARLRSTNDGFMDEVHAARDAYGADFVSLWVENGGGGCGIGYLMSTVSSGFATSAFNVTARSCATGNYSFGHELGHNMGLRHDLYVDTGTTPYTYAHGYIDTVNRFRTVMAYNDGCAAAGVTCTRIKGFSNLTLLYSSFPMGNATADNATVLNATATTTANFRQAVSSSVGFVADVERTVDEGVGTVVLSVIRVGSSTTTASVNWATVAGTATAGADFVAASGNLNWGVGDLAPKTITITVLQDALVETLEQFTVVLSSPVNTTLASAGTIATVRIRDDEPGIFPAGCAIPAGWTQVAGTSASWVASNTEASEGTCSLKAATITNSQSAGIQYAATVAAGTISFKYKVSSEGDYDCLRFAIDGVFQAIGGICPSSSPGASGEVDWTPVSIAVPAGARTFKWVYSKDSSLAAGDDTAWIDDVQYLAGTTTGIAASLSTTTQGQAVVFTATVSGGMPTGTVAFKVDGASIPGCVAVTLVAGSAACTTAGLAVGAHSITAAYSGDGGHAASASTGIAHTVNAAPVLAVTTTSLSAAVASSASGQSVTFSAKVLAASGTPTGTIVFRDGASPIAGCGPLAVVAGGASCAVASLSVGAHSITADYSGDGAFVASTSPVRVHVVVATGPVTAAQLLWRNYGNGDVYRMNVNALAVLGGAVVYKESLLPWKVVGTGDMDGDGVADLLYRHDTNGEVYVITLTTAGTVSGKAKIHTEPNAQWRIVHTPDLDGDGRDDLLWWNASTGQVYAMLLQGTTVKAQGFVYTESNTAWRIVAVGDFAGSGRKNQLLWRNVTTGQVYLQTVAHSGNGAFTQSGQMIYQEANTAWKILGAPDLDGNGRSDILWRNSTTGQVYAMLMNGAAIASQGMLYTEPNTTWKIVGWTDLNGDGRADLLWRNDTTGQVYVVLLNGLAIGSQGMLYTEPNADWKILGPWQYAQPFGGP